MVNVDCSTCAEKCCKYAGWKVFFLSEEVEKLRELYGAEAVGRLEAYQARSGCGVIHAVTLPCPFFKEETGQCGIYEARPLICRIFPMEVEVITGTVYLDQRVCPERNNASVQLGLVQIAVKDWCDRFWATSATESA
jgi:Fe-S-cluster containining protein